MTTSTCSFRENTGLPVLIISLFFLCIISLFAFLGHFAFPIVDDHSFALRVTEDGVWKHFVHMYFAASGRYAANMLYGISPVMVANPWLFHSLAGIQIVILVLAVRCLVGASHGGSAGSAWFMTLCLCGSFLATLPSPSQSLYWLSGSIVYFVSFNAFFGVAAVLAVAAFTPKALGPFHLLCLAGALLLAMGGNEITAAVCAFMLLAAWVCSLYTRHPHRWFFGAVFIAAMVLFCISFLAPGNFARIHEAERVWEWKFLLGVLGGAFAGYKWLLYTPVLPALALCALYFEPRWEPRDFEAPLRRRLLLVLACGCLLFLGEYLLVYVTSKRSPYARILNAIFDGTFVFALAATVFFMKDILHWRARLCTRFGLRRLVLVAGCAAILLTILRPTVSSALLNLANGSLAAHRAVWHERLALVAAARLAGEEVVALPALRSRPYPLIFRDLEESQQKHQWIGKSFAAYHGLKDIHIVHPAPSASTPQRETQ